MRLTWCSALLYSLYRKLNTNGDGMSSAEMPRHSGMFYGRVFCIVFCCVKGSYGIEHKTHESSTATEYCKTKNAFCKPNTFQLASSIVDLWLSVYKIYLFRSDWR